MPKYYPDQLDEAIDYAQQHPLPQPPATHPAHDACGPRPDIPTYLSWTDDSPHYEVSFPEPADSRVVSTSKRETFEALLYATYGRVAKLGGTALAYRVSDTLTHIEGHAATWRIWGEPLYGVDISYHRLQSGFFQRLRGGADLWHIRPMVYTPRIAMPRYAAAAALHGSGIPTNGDLAVANMTHPLDSMRDAVMIHNAAADPWARITL